MAQPVQTGRSPAIRTIVSLHKWLGIGAAAVFLLMAVTGVLLGFHSEIDDAVMSGERRGTDWTAIEKRLEAFDGAGGEARVNFIWTTTGLPDRWVVNHRSPAGDDMVARIDGAGTVLDERSTARDRFFGWVLRLHQSLLAGTVGHWILVVASVLLITNIIFGIVVSWPRRGHWRDALVPVRRGGAATRYYSWHRAIGLWVALPGLFIALSGLAILMEHEIREMVGAPDHELPANPPTGPDIGLAAAVKAAVAAVPGSRFVGTTMPGAEDASYHAWVQEPGSLYADGGYGGSYVVVDANDSSIRAAYPLIEQDFAYQFAGSFYPLHTGEVAGLTGRILTTILGVWLAAITAIGLMLWLRRRRPAARARTARAPGPAAESQG